MRLKPLSSRTRPFQESVIREMTRLSEKIGGVNLAQGLPDFAPPAAITKALAAALRDPANHQYAFTWGSAQFREAVARKTAEVNGIRADPARRRGARARALVRELRARVRARVGDAAVRAAHRVRLSPRPEEARGR